MKATTKKDSIPSRDRERKPEPQVKKTRVEEKAQKVWNPAALYF